MKHMHLHRVATILLSGWALFAVVIPAQAQITPQAAQARRREMQDLKREIAVNPVVVTQRRLDEVARPAAETPPAVTPKPAEEAPANNPPVEPVPTPAQDPASAAANPNGAASETQPPPQLERGRIYFAKVSAEKDRIFKSFVEGNVEKLANGAPVVTIGGVARVVSESGEEVQFKPYVYAGDGLTYEPGTSRFRGSFFVGVAALSEGPQDLSAPVIFQALESDRVRPGQMDVARSGPPYKAMIVEVADANSAVTLRVLTQYSPEVMSVTLPLSPTIRVTPSTTQMQGYGLGTTLVSVALVGVADPEGRTVIVTASPRGSFEPAQVKLDKFGNATTTLRSDGQGKMLLSAMLPGATPIPATVSFMLPLETVIAAFLGGLIGALVRLLPQQQRSRKDKFVISVIVAVLTGFIGFAVYAIGVNMLPFEPTVTKGAIVVFALSAVCAYLGRIFMERFRIFGG